METHACRQGECHGKMKAEVGAGLLRTRNPRHSQQTARSSGRGWNGASSRPSEGTSPDNALISDDQPLERRQRVSVIEATGLWCFIRTALGNHNHALPSQTSQQACEGSYWYPHFTNAGIKAHRGQVTCPKPHSSEKRGCHELCSALSTQAACDPLEH